MRLLLAIGAAIVITFLALTAVSSGKTCVNGLPHVLQLLCVK